MMLFYLSGHEVLCLNKRRSQSPSSVAQLPQLHSWVEWAMCHIIKIDRVHRPLYTYFMKLIFQRPPAHFNKRCQFQWNLHCVFTLRPWGKLQRGVSTVAIWELWHRQIHQKVSDEENSLTLGTSDRALLWVRRVPLISMWGDYND